MGKNRTGRIIPEKEQLVNAEKAALTAGVQAVLDRVMDELARDPEDADLIRKYGLALSARDLTYVRTHMTSGDHFNVFVIVRMDFPFAEATRTWTYKLDWQEEEVPPEDRDGPPGPAYLPHLIAALPGSPLPGQVRDLAIGLLDRLRRRDSAVTEGFGVKKKVLYTDAAVGTATAPGSEERYGKTAADRFRELCRGDSSGCLSETAVRLRLEDVSVSFQWKRKKSELTLVGDFRYASDRGEVFSAQSRATLRVSDLFGIFTEEGDFVPVLERNLENSAAELAEKQYGDVSLAYSDSGDTGLPRSLRQCLSMGAEGRLVSGSVSYPPLDDDWVFPDDPRHPPFTYVVWKGRPVAACGDPPLLQTGWEIDWEEAAEADDFPYSIDGTEPPRNPYEFAGFIFQAGDLYDGMEMLPGITEKPSVSFEFDSYFPERFMGYDYEGETIRDRLRSLFRAEMRKEHDREHFEDYDLGILDRAGLTEAELAVLDYIYKNGGQSVGSAAKLKTDPRMTREALEYALEKMTRIEVLLRDGDRIPLLRRELRYVDMLGSAYTVYCPQEDIPEGLVSRVRPRAYTFPDIEDFVPSVRDEWRARLMAAAGDSESRWEALTRFETFPEEFREGYIQTEEGQAFFAAFGGDDAVYAELVLRGIPGGDALADRLYGHLDRDRAFHNGPRDTGPGAPGERPVRGSGSGSVRKRRLYGQEKEKGKER